MKTKTLKEPKEILKLRGFHNEEMVYPTAFGIMKSMSEEVFTDLEKIKDTESLDMVHACANRLLSLYGIYFKN